MLKKLLLSLLLIGTTLLYATPTTESSLTRLYIATFDRAPDTKGLNYWLESGREIEEIAMNFFDQEETKAKYPEGFSEADFIQAIYQNLFNRDAETSGFEYWYDALESGKITRSLFILTIINGALGNDKKLLDNKTVVGLAFAKDGRDDIDEAHKVLSGITYDEDTVNSALCGYGLAGCKENKEEEEDDPYVPHPGGGDSNIPTDFSGVAVEPDTTDFVRLAGEIFDADGISSMKVTYSDGNVTHYSNTGVLSEVAKEDHLSVTIDVVDNLGKSSSFSRPLNYPTDFSDVKINIDVSSGYLYGSVRDLDKLATVDIEYDHNSSDYDSYSSNGEEIVVLESATPHPIGTYYSITAYDFLGRYTEYNGTIE